MTYEIIDALRMGKVFGRPKIGDRLALMINPADKEYTREELQQVITDEAGDYKII